MSEQRSIPEELQSLEQGPPSAEDFYGAPWAITKDGLDAAAANYRRWHAQEAGELEARRAQAVEVRNRRRADQYALADGIAVVELRGTMTKFGACWSSLPFGTTGVGAAVKAAARDPDVKGILVVIDSPGGLVAGTADLADVVSAAAAEKPVTAFVEDIGASAAYWVASQATTIVAGRTAAVGSIGTYMLVADFSAFLEAKGIEVSVIRAGANKGIGAFGAPITEDDKAVLQETVDELNSHFLDAVGRGRRFDSGRVAKLADGRVHIGPRAVELGLADSIGSFASALSDLATGASSSAPKSIPRGAARGDSETAKEDDTMSTSESGPSAATLQELRAACPGASNDFLVEQLDKGATADEAARAWMRALAQERDAARARADEAEERANAAAENGDDGDDGDDGDEEDEEDEEENGAGARVRRPGVPPLRNGSSSSSSSAGGDPISEWNARIEEKTGGDSKKRAEAIRQLVSEAPELHQHYLDAHNDRFRKSSGRRAGASV